LASAGSGTDVASDAHAHVRLKRDARPSSLPISLSVPTATVAIASVAAMAAVGGAAPASAMAAMVAVPMMPMVTGHRPAMRRAAGAAAEVARAARTAARRSEPAGGEVTPAPGSRGWAAPIANVVASAGRTSRRTSPADRVRSHPADDGIGCRRFTERGDQSLTQPTDVWVAQVNASLTAGRRAAIWAGTIVPGAHHAATAKSSESTATRTEPTGTARPETEPTTRTESAEAAAAEAAATICVGAACASAGGRCAAIVVQAPTVIRPAPIGRPRAIIGIPSTAEAAAAEPAEPAAAARARPANAAATGRAAAVVVPSAPITLIAAIVSAVRPPRFVSVPPSPVVAAVAISGAFAGRRPAVRLAGAVVVGPHGDGQRQGQAAPQTRSHESAHGQLLRFALVCGVPAVILNKRP
jgi:hypothetical protein